MRYDSEVGKGGTSKLRPEVGTSDYDFNAQAADFLDYITSILEHRKWAKDAVLPVWTHDGYTVRWRNISTSAYDWSLIGPGLTFNQLQIRLGLEEKPSQWRQAFNQALDVAAATCTRLAADWETLQAGRPLHEPLTAADRFLVEAILILQQAGWNPQPPSYGYNDSSRLYTWQAPGNNSEDRVRFNYLDGDAPVRKVTYTPGRPSYNNQSLSILYTTTLRQVDTALATLRAYLASLVLRKTHLDEIYQATNRPGDLQSLNQKIEQLTAILPHPSSDDVSAALVPHELGQLLQTRKLLLGQLRGVATPLPDTDVTRQLAAGRIVAAIVESSREQAHAFIVREEEVTSEVVRARAKKTIGQLLAERLEAGTPPGILTQVINQAGLDVLNPHSALVSYIDLILRAWANSAGDSSEAALLTQMAAAKEFNLPSANLDIIQQYLISQSQEGLWAKTQLRLASYGGPLRQMILRAMYDYTQESLAAAGIAHVSIFRGMRLAITPPEVTLLLRGERALGRVALQPLSSWSSDLDVARRFASCGNGSVVLHATVPASRLLATARTGMGCLREFEFVLIETGATSSEYLIEQRDAGALLPMGVVS